MPAALDLLGAPKSGRTLACKALSGEAITQGGVDLITDVVGDIPPFCVRPKAGDKGTVGEEATSTDWRELGAVQEAHTDCV